MIFTITIEKTRDGCMHCTLMKQSLEWIWMLQWCEQVYVAILPLIAVWFYNNKYHEHPDYEALDKAGKRSKRFLSKVICVCFCFALLVRLAISLKNSRQHLNQSEVK